MNTNLYVWRGGRISKLDGSPEVLQNAARYILWEAFKNLEAMSHHMLITPEFQVVGVRHKFFFFFLKDSQGNTMHSKVWESFVYPTESILIICKIWSQSTSQNPYVLNFLELPLQSTTNVGALQQKSIVSFLEAKVWNQAVGRATLPPKPWWGKILPCLLQLLVPPSVLWFVAT